MVANDVAIGSPELSMRCCPESVRYKLVDADEFAELAISCARRLVRCDDPEAGLRGLFDPETGERFVISERELLQHQR